MSERVQSRTSTNAKSTKPTGRKPVNDRAVKDKAANETPLSKQEKRALAREAKAKAIAAKRRREALIGTVAGLAVIGFIIGAWYVVGTGTDSGNDAASTTSSASSSPTDSAAKPFPPVPDGADPALMTKPTVTAGTGEITKLTVTPLIEGNGPAVQAGQKVTVNYVGVTYKTGEEFDASWNRQQPFQFAVGAGQVIPGWDQGLVGVKVGSRVQLDIPSNLAYGDDPNSGRPVGTLRFVVDVLGVA
jgi:peptidylprolyl isomerase